MTATTFTTKEWTFAKLKKARATYNPRTWTDYALEYLMLSLLEFGQVENLVINIRTGNLVSGHMRLEGALCLVELEMITWKGMTVLEIDVSETKEKALNIGLNNPAMQGDYDEEGLEAIIHELMDAPDFDLEVTGFDEDDWLRPDELDDGIDEVPAKPKKPKTKVGDIYIIGKHRVLCGDSTKPEDIRRLMGRRKAAILLTDPPYGLGKEYEEGVDLVPFTNRWWWAVDKFVNPDDKWKLVFWSMGRLREIYDTDIGDELTPRGFLIWHQPNSASARSNGMFWSWQPIALTGKRKAIFNEDAVDVFIQSFPILERQGHPTQKPVALISRLIKKFSHKNELIIDPFLGSGSTVVAAEEMNRRCFGLELDPGYVDVIVARMKKLYPKIKIKRKPKKKEGRK